MSKIIGLREYGEEYAPRTVFDRADFASLNEYRAREVRVVAEGGAAIVLGRGEDRLWHAPFSAPYALPAGDGDLHALAAALIPYAAEGLVLTPAPVFYPGAREWCEVLDILDAERIEDVNYHYPLERLADEEAFMSRMARRNLHKALREDFMLQPSEDIHTVYAFIAEHHRRLGYRMAMTEEAVLETAAILPVDFFEIRHGDRLAGAAIYYRVCDGIAQLINWGDDPDLRTLRTSSFMAHAIFTHYAEEGLHTVDLGPASTRGVRNEGLIAFKLSLGAVETVKPTFITAL